MELYVGLDVSLEETSICVLDQSGVIVFEGSAPSRPEAIAKPCGGGRRRGAESSSRRALWRTGCGMN
jgi:hypothetical protein